MAKAQNSGRNLEVADDREWQERFWKFQRFAWLLLAVFVLAALAGATGKGGPLASAVARAPTGIVEYPRITRWQSDEDVIVRLPPSAGGEVELLVSPAFAEVFGIDSIVPQPVQAKATADGHLFTFATEAGRGEKELVLHVTAGKPTLDQAVDVRIGGAAVRLDVTVLP